METNHQKQPNLRAEYLYSDGSGATEVPKLKLAAAINCYRRTPRKKQPWNSFKTKSYLSRVTSTRVNPSPNRAAPRILRGANIVVTSADVNLVLLRTYLHIFERNTAFTLNVSNARIHFSNPNRNWQLILNSITTNF